MTKKLSSLNWRDALYNAVRNSSGGVNGAALFLSERRGVSIHPESLRRKLTGGEQLDPDLCILLQEHLAQFVSSKEESQDWIIALAQQAGLNVVHLPDEPVGGFEDEAAALSAKAIKCTSELGELCTAIMKTTADGRVTDDERQMVVSKAWELARLCFRIIRNVTRWRRKEVGLYE